MLSLPHTVSSLEILWTVIGAIPFVLGVLLIRSLMRDRAVLKNDGVNGADDIVIVTWIGLVAFELVSTGAIVGTGITAMLIPVTSAGQITATGIAITVGFLVIGCASAAVMFWVVVRRLLLRLHLQAKYNVGHISMITDSRTKAQPKQPPVDAL